MFSGKTTELLRRLRLERIGKRSALLIKYSKDTRYCVVVSPNSPAAESACVTHDFMRESAAAVNNLEDIADTALTYDVIGIDAGQMFPDIVSFSDNLANHGKRVIVSALDATYKRTPFGHIHELVSRAESIVKLEAVCEYCHAPAAFTQLRSGIFVNRIGSDDILIGGSEIYTAACRACYRQIGPP
jgi:thymidine kinase